MGNEHDKWLKDALGVEVNRQPADAPGSGPALKTGQPVEDKKVRVAALRAKRKALEAESEQLEAEKPPDEQARELQDGLAFIQELLSDTSKDAAERSKQIEEYVEKVKKANPKNSKITQSLKKITDFAGKVGKGVGKTAKTLEEINKELSKAQELLQVFMTNFEVMESGSATDQLNEFKNVFDKLRKDVPGLDELPGVSQMLQIYSEAIAAIAKSTASIEKEVKQRDEMAKEAVGTPLYMHFKSKREQLADRRALIAAKLAETDRALEDEGPEEQEPRPRTRQELAHQICKDHCSDPERDWRESAARAAELERQATQAAAALAQARRDLASFPQTMERAKLGIVEFDKELAHYQKQLDNPADPKSAKDLAEELKKIIASVKDRRSKLGQELDQRKARLKWMTEAVTSGEREAKEQTAKAQAARDAATQAKVAYDKCRRDWYQKAIAGGDLMEMPADLR